MSLQSMINDLKCEQEELEECGDLEDRLACAEKLAGLMKIKPGKEKWFPCGICYGRGEHIEFGESWKCPLCLGYGGTFLEA